MRLDARFFFFLAMYSLFSYISDIEFQEKKKKDNARCTILNRITQRLHYHLGNFLESDLAIG